MRHVSISNRSHIQQIAYLFIIGVCILFVQRFIEKNDLNFFDRFGSILPCQPSGSLGASDAVNYVFVGLFQSDIDLTIATRLADQTTGENITHLVALIAFSKHGILYDSFSFKSFIGNFFRQK
jgi:hypothetical protein